MKIRSKHVEYIKHIMDEEKITVSKLGELIGKSSKTVVKDLDELEGVMRKNGITLVRKQGQGIWFEAADDKLFKLNEEIMRRLSLEEDLDFKLVEILLFISFGNYSATEIASVAFISSGAVTTSIQKLNEYLSDYHIQIDNSQKCLRLVGREPNIRKVLFGLIKREVDIWTLISYITAEQKNSRISIVFNQGLKLLKEQINGFELSHEVKVTDQSFLDLYLYYLISSIRVTQKNTIDSYERVRINYRKVKYCDEISNIFNKVALDYYGVELDVNERKYFTFIISNHLSIKVKHNSVSDIHLKDLVRQGLENANYLVNYDLTTDRDLMDGLLNHLVPALNRLANNISPNSPFTSQIKSDYELAFNIAKIIIVSIPNYYQAYENIDDEIAQIALHVQASIERYAFETTNKINVCIVSSSGQGSPQLIKSKLIKQFDNIAKADILSVFEYYSIDIKKYDLVVSTTYINQLGVPIINVSPLMSYGDLNKMSNYLIQADMRSKVKSEIEQLISEQLCFIVDFKTKQEVLNFIASELAKAHLVDTEFYLSLINREKVASTDNMKFAVPHGNPKHVYKDGVVVIINRTPIDWGKHQIKLIILPLISVLSQVDASQIMNSVFDLKTNEKLLAEIDNCQSKGELYKLLKGENDSI